MRSQVIVTVIAALVGVAAATGLKDAAVAHKGFTTIVKQGIVSTSGTDGLAASITPTASVYV